MSAVAETMLTNADRCDRCGSRAYIHVTLPGGGTLLFCRRDGLANMDALKLQGAQVVDETDQLNH